MTERETRGTLHVDARKHLREMQNRYERVPETIVRELVQNSSDALFFDHGEDAPRIRIGLTDDGIFIQDNGCGLSDDALDALAEVHGSWTRQTLDEGARTETVPGQPEGRFGVGFYTLSIVASRIVLQTRARSTGAAAEWELDPEEFTYRRLSLSEAERRERGFENEFGTRVEITLQDRWRRQLFDEERLVKLVERVAEFVNWPIDVGDRAAVNRRHGPWDDPDSGPEAYIEYLRTTGYLPERESPLAMACLPWNERLGIGGVLFVPPRAVEQPGIALHLNRYFVGHNPELLPEEFRWCGGIVLARDVRINEARERLIEDERLLLFRRRLISWLLCGDPGWGAPQAGLQKFLTTDTYVLNGGLRKALQERDRQTGILHRKYGERLLRLATMSTDVLVALGRHLPLPIVSSQPQSLAELLPDMENDRTLSVLFDPAHETSAAEQPSETGAVINATSRHVEQFLRRIDREIGLELRVVVSEAPEVEDKDWAPVKRLLSQRLGSAVGSVKFSRGGGLPPFVIDEFALGRMKGIEAKDSLDVLRCPREYLVDREDVLERRAELFGRLRDLAWPLRVNIESELAQKLLELAGADQPTAEPLAWCLLSIARQDLAIDWPAEDRHSFNDLHIGALHDLLDRADD